jgi:hypothetical protein
VFSSLDIVFCDLGQGAQVLPAQGSQEHDKGQVDGGIVASGDHLTVGKILCPDRGDDLPCFTRRWVRVGDSVINLLKKGKTSQCCGAGAS